MTNEDKVIPFVPLSKSKQRSNRAKKFLTKIYKNMWFRLIFIALLIWLGWIMRQDIREYGQFILDQDNFSDYIRGLGIWGPILMWTLNAIQILIAILPGHAIALASGYIYGTIYGFIILYTSTIVSGQIAFLLARRFGRPLVERMVPEKYLSRWDVGSEKHGFIYYLIALLIPVFPTDLLTYVAGLSMISIPKFTLANIIGRAPYLFLISMVGAFGIEVFSHGLTRLEWIMVAIAAVLIFLAYKYMLPIISREIFGEEK